MRQDARVTACTPVTSAFETEIRLVLSAVHGRDPFHRIDITSPVRRIVDLLYTAVRGRSFKSLIIFEEMTRVYVFRLAHLRCDSLLFRSSRLSSVCLSRVRSRKLSKMGAKFRLPYRKSGSPSTNNMSEILCRK